MPPNWCIARFDDICKIVSGKNQKAVENRDGRYPIMGSGGIIGYADSYLCEAGTTVVGRKGTINNPIWVNTKFWNVDTAFGLTPGVGINKKLFYYFCCGFNFKELDKSTTIPSLAKTDLLQIHFPLPPLAEQERIVAKIEELFSSLDKGIENLKTAQAQLKVYRQAVLKQAFEGKLTNKNVKDGELPEGWNIKELKEVCEIKRGVSKHRPRDAKELYGGNYPFIQTGDVRAANGGVIRRYSQTYNETGLKQSRLWPMNTLCLTIAANIGETAFLGFDACFPDSVVGIIESPGLSHIKYISYYMQRVKQDLNRIAPATAQKNINVDILEKVPFPLPPNIAAQEAVVAEIESRLSVCDNMEESIQISLNKAEALRRSILKKAFEGKLVPQNPNDEPASVLLERIRKERTKSDVKTSRIKNCGNVSKDESTSEPGPRKRGRPRKTEKQEARNSKGMRNYGD